MTLTMLGQVACTAPITDEDEEWVGDTQQAALTGNALSGNALTGNALTGNALTGNALTGNALTGNALTGNALTDPDAREVLKYIVSCALPKDEQIKIKVQGKTYKFKGQLGLAPEWGEEGGSCDAECKSWVSACVISRLDYAGEPLTISVRGDHEGLAPSHKELKKYQHREATYYGNIFSSKQKIFACLPPGQSSIPRVCGDSLDDCVVEVQGDCEDLCDDERWDGSYPNCRADGKPKKHVGSVTVFLMGQ